MSSKILFSVLLAAVFSTVASSAADRPNVVLIVCDDLNTDIGHLGGHPQARTPNIDRLARSGVSFRRAYSNNPICAPSRSSFLTGIYPHTSGNLFWGKWFENEVLANSKTIMEHFRDNGYRVVGSGKLMHHFRREVWDEFANQADYGPMAFDGKQRVGHPSVPEPFRSIGPVDGSFGPLSDVPFGGKNGKGWIYGKWNETRPFRYISEDDRSPTPDERNARWAADRIRRFAETGADQPFFLAVGFIRPHTPLHVPKKYFDMFPLDALELPVIKPGDADDCHYRDVFHDDVKGLRYYATLGESYPTIQDGLRAFLQAYLACVAAVDDQIGIILDAVDESGLKEKTIIIVTSDHGWHNGQKEYLFKNSLWEESTRVPFIVRAPGVTKAGGMAEHPIALIDLYPTLVGLCNLKGDTPKNERGRPLDGHSICPFLEDPTSRDWTGPDGALTMVYAGGHSKTALTQTDLRDPAKQHWSLRTQRWRYVLYNNGAEELYDHTNDPYEWTNLADDPNQTSTKNKLKDDLLRMRGAEPRHAPRGTDKRNSANVRRHADETGPQVNVDWASFLARHDLVWDSMSTGYLDSPFVGNGLLGAMLAQEGDDCLKLSVGRTDVTEHVAGPGIAHYIGKSRLPIGAFQLKLPGPISDGKMRLDLYQAETRGHLMMDRGKTPFRLFTHAEQPVIVFEWRLAENGGTAKLQWIPALARVPRGKLPGPANPAPMIGTRGNVQMCVQSRQSGGDYTTAWRKVTLEDGTHRLFVSIADRFPEGGSVDEAVAAVERAAGTDFDAFVQSHRTWWKNYYPASFVSAPHPRMESFYWIQIYKLGSAIRKGGPMCDLMGPWYKDTRWPAIWWNLNTQMLYSPFPVANRLEMAENLSDRLLKHRANLIANVPEPWRHDSAGISRCTGTDLLEQYDRWKEKANLIWVCHNLWVQYRCTMDEVFLRDELYPLLWRAVNTYLHQLEKDDQGVYHIPEGHSPEAFSGKDTNYDLASLRWGCRTLLRITKRLRIEDELADRWKDVLDHLTPYPQDETGYMGGPGHPAPRGHRHWSHLIMIYPYYETNWDQREHRDVIRRSCQYWSDPGVRNTWSQAVMSSMQSSVGNGDGALLHMERALNTRHLGPNTMHFEAERRVAPCSETHGGMCQMLHDMLIQSWGDKIRVFPGVSKDWKDAVFHNLRAEGAFLVSAVRREGKTAWVHLQSLAGEPCLLQADFGGETPKVLANRAMKLTTVSPGVWSLDINKGESAVLYAGADAPRQEIAPLPMAAEEMNHYGLRAKR